VVKSAVLVRIGLGLFENDLALLLIKAYSNSDLSFGTTFAYPPENSDGFIEYSNGITSFPSVFI